VAVFSFLCTRRLIREWGPRFHHVFTGFSVCILGIALGALFGNVRFICCAHFAAVSGASLVAFLSYGLFPGLVGCCLCNDFERLWECWEHACCS
jgi:drug/metabolite transporter (DMT)-like permease